jgi:hypothetical protein
MARFSPEDRQTIWDMREAGMPVKTHRQASGQAKLRPPKVHRRCQRNPPDGT